MSSCKDCLHDEACSIFAGDLNEEGAEKCVCFKDRNRVVELPCKIGDKYYRVEKFCTEGGYLDEPKLVSVSDCEYCCEECNKEYRVVEYQFNSIIQILQKEYYISKTVFLTREEAERALKERENNG